MSLPPRPKILDDRRVGDGGVASTHGDCTPVHQDPACRVAADRDVVGTTVTVDRQYAVAERRRCRRTRLLCRQDDRTGTDHRADDEPTLNASPPAALSCVHVVLLVRCSGPPIGRLSCCSPVRPGGTNGSRATPADVSWGSAPDGTQAGFPQPPPTFVRHRLARRAGNRAFATGVISALKNARLPESHNVRSDVTPAR